MGGLGLSKPSISVERVVVFELFAYSVSFVVLGLSCGASYPFPAPLGHVLAVFSGGPGPQNRTDGNPLFVIFENILSALQRAFDTQAVPKCRPKLPKMSPRRPQVLPRGPKGLSLGVPKVHRVRRSREASSIIIVSSIKPRTNTRYTASNEPTQEQS